jgi:hypothetical protein
MTTPRTTREVALQVSLEKYRSDMAVTASENRPSTFITPATTKELLERADEVYAWLSQEDSTAP